MLIPSVDSNWNRFHLGDHFPTRSQCIEVKAGSRQACILLLQTHRNQAPRMEVPKEFFGFLFPSRSSRKWEAFWSLGSHISMQNGHLVLVAILVIKN